MYVCLYIARGPYETLWCAKDGSRRLKAQSFPLTWEFSENIKQFSLSQFI